jgi:hypothetical protein
MVLADVADAPCTSSFARNTERCNECGYLLAGLPDSGRCPECGQTYDQSLITLNGWGGHTRYMSGFGQRGWRSVLAVIWPGFVFWLLFLNVLRRSHGPLWLVIALSSLPVIATTARVVLRRTSGDGVPPMKLILSPHGWTWGLHTSAQGASKLDGICALSSYLSLYFVWARESPWIILYFAVLYALLLGYALLRKRIRAWRRRRLPAGDVPDPVSALIPWEPSKRLVFTQTAPELWKVTLMLDKNRKRKSFRLQSRPADMVFEIPLSESRLSHITAQISTWPVELEVVRPSRDRRPFGCRDNSGGGLGEYGRE